MLLGNLSRCVKKDVCLLLVVAVACLCMVSSRYKHSGTLPHGRPFFAAPAFATRFVSSKSVITTESLATTTALETNNSSTVNQSADPDKGATSLETETNFIDIDKMVPPLDVLYEKLTLVTSFSQNHFKEGLGFIGSAQRQMPNKTIIVYDLGLNKESISKIKSFCNVKLRRFNFESYPQHVKKLRTYGFKPTIINLVLNEFGVIYYGDASIRFKKPLFELIPDCVSHHGFLGQIRCFDPKVPKGRKYSCFHDYRLTKNEMYGKIGVNKTEWYNANFSSPAFSGGLMLVINGTTMQSKIMKPWLQCASDVTCIAPRGASLSNHRFDQSALSLIVFKNMRNEWTLENDPTPHHNSVVSVSRGTNGEKWNPMTC